MNRDDIIRMAREAGLAHWDDMVQADAFSFVLPKRLERFAALVAAHERDKLLLSAEWCRVCEQRRFAHENTTSDATD